MNPTRTGAAAAAAAVALATLAGACSDSTGPKEPGGRVTVGFDVASPSAATVAFAGTNGVLTVTEVWLVMDEFRLERITAACEIVLVESPDDDCEELQAPPFFVWVPLEGGTAWTVGTDIAPGPYVELEFETRAPDDDEADAALLAEIQASYFADWPAGASLLVVGTFTKTTFSPPREVTTPFRAYLDAEVEVELAFGEEMPLMVVEGGGRLVIVSIDPAVWFTNGDGTVIDLSVYDYDVTGEVFPFDGDLTGGFAGIELDGA